MNKLRRWKQRQRKRDREYSAALRRWLVRRGKAAMTPGQESVALQWRDLAHAVGFDAAVDDQRTKALREAFEGHRA